MIGNGFPLSDARWEGGLADCGKVRGTVYKIPHHIINGETLRLEVEILN